MPFPEQFNAFYYLDHLYNKFLIERLSIRRLKTSETPLLNVSKEILTITIEAWNRVEQLKMIPGDLAWMVRISRYQYRKKAYLQNPVGQCIRPTSCRDSRHRAPPADSARLHTSCCHTSFRNDSKSQRDGIQDGVHCSTWGGKLCSFYTSSQDATSDTWRLARTTSTTTSSASHDKCVHWSRQWGLWLLTVNVFWKLPEYQPQWCGEHRLVLVWPAGFQWRLLVERSRTSIACTGGFDGIKWQSARFCIHFGDGGTSVFLFFCFLRYPYLSRLTGFDQAPRTWPTKM